MNQTQLAKLLGMSQTGYSKYETKTIFPPGPVGAAARHQTILLTDQSIPGRNRPGKKQPGPAASAAGPGVLTNHRQRRMAWATPSSPLEGTVSRQAAFTWGAALPMAMGVPTARRTARSLSLSPTAAHRSRGTP